MTGIPSGRLSALPGLGIYTRRTGYDFMCLHCLGWIRSTMTSRCAGGTAFTPSTPAVFLPWLSLSPAALPADVPPVTSSEVFGVCGLLVCCHVGWLERFSFVCGTHAALVCARATCANSHSQHQAGAWCWVPSFLPYDSLLFLPDHRADVSVSPGFPSGVGFFGNPALKGLRLVPCSSYRPPTRTHLRVFPFRHSVLRSRRRMLSTG